MRTCKRSETSRRRAPQTAASILAVALWALLAGCATESSRTLEARTARSVATPYAGPRRLDEDIACTRAEGKRVPPGVHAHLGFLHYTPGGRESARAHFARERELFPAKLPKRWKRATPRCSWQPHGDHWPGIHRATVDSPSTRA